LAGLAGITTPQFCHHHSCSRPSLPRCITCPKSSPTAAPHKNASNFQRSHPAPSHQQRSRSCHSHKERNARTTHISTDGMALLIVMNPAPPPPYSPRSPLSSDSFPTATPMLTPAITHLLSQAVAEPAGNTLPRSLFPPHPHAPKPNLSPQGPLYGLRTCDGACAIPTFEFADPGNVQGYSDTCYAKRSPTFQQDLWISHSRSLCGLGARANPFFYRSSAQYLRTIFQRSPLLRLRHRHCRRFPLLYKIRVLQLLVCSNCQSSLRLQC